MVFLFQTAVSQSILEIKFNSLEYGKVFILNSATNKLDTLIIKDGQSSFNTAITAPTLYAVIIEGYNESRPLKLILSNKRTAIEFDTLNKVVSNQSVRHSYLIPPNFLKDPNSNIVFYEFLSLWMDFFNNIENLSSSNSKDLLEERKTAYFSFLNQCDSVIRKYNNKFVSAVIIDFLLRDNLLQIETIQNYYDYLSQDVKDSFFGIEIGQYAGKSGKHSPGNLAPEFEVYDWNNKRHDLSSLKGKKVLLHFWSSSCAPCIKEAPELIKLTKENEDKLSTINISLDTDENKWKKGIERAGLEKMTNVCDLTGFMSNIVQNYAINVIPSYYLIDENGRIIMKGSLNQARERIK